MQAERTDSLTPSYVKACIRAYRHALNRRRSSDSTRLASTFIGWASELGVQTEDRGVFPIANDVLARVEEMHA